MKLEVSKMTLEMLSDSTTVPNVLLDHYKELGLNEEETLFLIVLLRLKAKKSVLSFKNTARDSNYSEKEVKESAAQLIDKGFLRLNCEGFIELNGLIDKFVEVLNIRAIKSAEKIKKEKQAIKEDKVFSALYLRFEQEMGRPLSPIEGEQISYWYHNQNISAELIEEGLKRAVLLGKYNFRYIEAMLRSWQKQEIHSVADLKKADENRKPAAKNGAKKNERIFRNGQEEIYSDDIYEVF
ncbi:MAG TPA: DnaD domain protein [Clostridiales bacterium]|nr:DnaD domain protein [Clostridiales bacterium]